MASYDARDYGAQFSPPLITNHILVRWQTATPTVNCFFVQTMTQHATAGVVLVNGVVRPNGSKADVLKCYSRGEQAASARNSRTVIWSPRAQQGATALIQADNPAAVFHLRKNGYYPLRDRKDSGAALVLDHLAPLAGFQKVTGVTITTGGTGYTSAPMVIFSAPPEGITATGTATVAGGAVTSIRITNPGTGYTTAPIISFSGGGGTGAVAIATIKVTGVIITNGGTGYATHPL